MKKQNQKAKKKKSAKKKAAASRKQQAESKPQEAAKAAKKEKEPREISKKAPARRADQPGGLAGYIRKGVQFLREARMELKKVKWPTRKELLASTAVVIVLTLVVALFLGLCDFGLIKIIKVLVG